MAGRRALLTALHPDDEGHAAAMLRAVQAAPPGTAPAFAHVRLRMADAGCLWSELKLSSDVRRGSKLLCRRRRAFCSERIARARSAWLTRSLRASTRTACCAT